MKIFLNVARLLVLFILAAFSITVAPGQPSEDAIILTLRAQQGIKLDTAIAASIDSGLSAARQALDTLHSIHAWPTYILNNLIVETTAPWSQAWVQGTLHTGEPYLDSLDQEYGLVEVDAFVPSLFLLTFSQPLRMDRLDTVYERQPGIDDAEPNGLGGGGDDIAYFRKSDTMYFVFSYGWGDCPVGCASRFYWYVAVGRDHDSLAAHLQEEEPSDIALPYFNRWNIPPVYAMTMFPDADSIFHTISASPVWWLRRHAIEGTWRFFADTLPWARYENLNQWRLLRSELLSRRPDVQAILRSAVSDPDSDVSASALNALMQIHDTTDILTVSVPVGHLWNLVSNPISGVNNTVTAMYPAGISAAFAFSPGGYISSARIEQGKGYWLKFASDTAVTMTGVTIDSVSISVKAGWNLIGSVTAPVGVTTLSTLPPGMTASQAWGYLPGSGYYTVDSIRPGKGYWIKLSGDGTLILSSVAGGMRAGTIRIVSTPELPPAPPAEPGDGAITALPTEYRMEQNYPNPFNPSTIFNYALPADSYVRITIFNTLGQSIEVLKDEIQSAGYKEIHWNAASIASGIYFYRFDAISVSDPTKHFSRTRKMILCK